MLQAVLFDLDGTLIGVNSEEFVWEYLKEISAATAAVVEPEHFVRTLLASTKVMQQKRKERQLNADVFWADFCARLGKNIEDLKPLMDEYYANQFKNLARITRPDEKAQYAVQKVLDLGLRIVLATNPVFPESAIRDRMDWAGVGDMPWEFITSYENMHYSKPHSEYYLEIASRLKLEPANCLMVGNEMQNDIIPAAAAGMRTFLIGDYAVDTCDIQADGCGDLPALITWLNDYINNYQK